MVSSPLYSTSTAPAVNGEEALILKDSDYKSPSCSPVLQRLAKSDEPAVRTVGGILFEACSRGMEEIPPFEPLSSAAPRSRPIQSNGVPTWVTELRQPEKAEEAGDAETEREVAGAGWVASHFAPVTLSQWSVGTIPRLFSAGILAVLLALSIVMPIVGLPASVATLGLMLGGLCVSARGSSEWLQAQQARDEVRVAAVRARDARTRLAGLEAELRKPSRAAAEAPVTLGGWHMRLLRSATKIALKKNHARATKAFVAGHISR